MPKLKEVQSLPDGVEAGKTCLYYFDGWRVGIPDGQKGKLVYIKPAGKKRKRWIAICDIKAITTTGKDDI